LAYISAAESIGVSSTTAVRAITPFKVIHKVTPFGAIESSYRTS